MFRIRTLTDARQAKSYYQQSDYYLETPGEWMGKGAARLGLKGPAAQKDFEALCDNINPATGQALTALTIEGRRIGNDFNFNSSKSVGIARELVGIFDPEEGQRIEDAHREAVAHAMGHVERDMACRVRVDGKDEDRVTGNLIALRVTHRTTRPNEDDQTPDMELHDHVVVINATFDDVEDGKCKATQIGDIWSHASYYESLYHNRLAANLQSLGYGIRRKGKGFEIAGVSDELVERFSRRKRAIEKLARALGITTPEGKDKLGATTRLSKDKSRLVELQPYWDGKLNGGERDQLRRLKGQLSYRSHVKTAMTHAIAHTFERHSVVDPRTLYEEAIRFGIGSVPPELLRDEAARQGVLFIGDGRGECTTREVFDQESKIIGFARKGKGTFRPIAPGKTDGLEGLSSEQKAAVRHVWGSADQVMLVRGGAGTGKTTMMTPALARLGRPSMLLAPTADASRGQLRQEGFADANTVAAFLGDKKMQDKVRGGGIIWIDEAGLTPINDLEKVCDLAHELRARVVLQGDPNQHLSVQRHGNMLHVLHDFAALPVAELTEIRRQGGAYAQAVAAIRDQDFVKADGIFRKLGWVVEGDGHDKLVEEYARAIEERKASGDQKTVLVIDPTHKDGDVLSDQLRDLRKAKGLIGRKDRPFTRLVAVDLTNAQKADAHNYAGDETIQFFRNCGKFKAGSRIKASELLPDLPTLKADSFAVYEERSLPLAAGDTIRITANGRDVTGKHRIDNGRIDTIRGFTSEGNPVLANGWVIAKDFGHLRHGLVSTSPASQSKTVDIVLTAMNRASGGAIGTAQAYVSASRGRERGMIFTDLPQDELLAAMRRADTRKSATELMAEAGPEPLTPDQRQALHRYMERRRHEEHRRTRRMRERAQQVLLEKDVSHAR
jgi:conjugative relaxase-like TrwC/TraI family protein